MRICAGEQAFEGAILRKLVRALPENTPVFLANSLTIRSTEWFAGRAEKTLRCFGNRGLSGIDGNLSTAWESPPLSGDAWPSSATSPSCMTSTRWLSRGKFP